jgi:acyl-CoA thioester hydrolase
VAGRRIAPGGDTRHHPGCRSVTAAVARHRSLISIFSDYSVTTTALDGEIRDGGHHMQVRVYFEDTDAGRIVYHANYLRFMERGRTNYLRLLGTHQRGLIEETADEAPGFAFVVRSIKIDFFKPAYLDDLLDVVTTPQEIKGASITLLQRCVRGGDLLAEASVRVAFVSGGKAQRIPKPLRIAMGETA